MATNGDKITSENGKKRIIFTLKAEPGSNVFVAGTFNDWKADKKRLVDKTEDGTYSCTLMLAPGQYEYKFKINDEWLIDESNSSFTRNQFGTLNSVLTVL
jgi:1,4-alpha-glucan branching enzyme